MPASTSNTPSGSTLDLEAALAVLIASVAPDASRADVQELRLDECTGRTLAEELRADRDLPPFDRAERDGYALRSAELKAGVPMPVVASIAAGMPWSGEVPRGACVAIATGAAVPPGLDTVIEHECSDRRNPVSFAIEPTQGAYIHRRGSDARAGAVVAGAGVRMTSREIAVAAAAGRSCASVRVQPRVAIITSGDEVRSGAAPLLPHQIRDSNGPMLGALIEAFSGLTVSHRHALDDPRSTRAALEAATGEAEVIVTVGGVSVGERDHMPGSLAELKATPLFRGCRIQPGGPVTAWRDPQGRTILCLPGNPVSALVTAHLFLWPLLRVLSGLEATLSWRRVALHAAVRPNPRKQLFRAARLDGDGASVPTWSGSGDLVHTVGTDGLVALPIQSEDVLAGTLIPFLAWADA